MFIDHKGSFYHRPYPGNICPKPAFYDGTNRYYSNIPNDFYGFIVENKYYLDYFVDHDDSYEDDRPLDHVKGCTLEQLETAITGAFRMRNWKKIQ